MAQMQDDPAFRRFATSLTSAIKSISDKDAKSLQRGQLELLLKLEKEFRLTLIKHRSGPTVYREFIEFICDKKRNILAARPYFRERQEVFTRRISPALKARAEKSLFRFNFNFQFIQFVMRSRKWGKGSKLTQLAAEISKVREELVTMNMPLGISRARIFYSRTPKSHLDYMDFVNIACEGLTKAIDKFVGPLYDKFNAVAIGRMTGDFIENYSETPIHFYPKDRRKLYNANKAIGKMVESVDTVDHEVLAGAVNEKLTDGSTNAGEIANLLAAASCVSADTPIDIDEEMVAIDRFAAPVDCQPDVQVERADALRATAAAVAKLSVLDQKILKLKGFCL